MNSSHSLTGISDVHARSGTLRAMIVEDSQVMREFLIHVISQDPRLRVCAAVGSGEEALRVLWREAPDVISMDIRLPGMNGFEATQQIMAERPTPIVVLAANVDAGDLKIPINALRAGALSVLEKPSCATRESYEAFAERLCTQLAIMSQVKVITQRSGKGQRQTRPPVVPRQRGRMASDAYELLAVVASTGGPAALSELLDGLGPDFPLPILLVQHITSSFSKAFIEWLNDVCPLNVVQAQSGMRPQPGHVYVPPGDRHLLVRRRLLLLDHSGMVSMQRPSGTVLLHSVASEFGARAIGIVLTGMGDDGAQGLLSLRQAGGYSIAENESTAVVYGMPGAAVALGAVCESLALQRIAPRVVQLVQG